MSLLLTTAHCKPHQPATATPPSILTQRYDTQRTGANLQESELTPAAVGGGRFGLLFSRTVVGQIYGQPLYVPGLAVAGHGVHDVVLVATENNEVYAFDASDPAAADPLWHVTLGSPMPHADAGDTGITVDVGITSTPVIDLSRGTIYVVAQNKEAGVHLQRLHALALADGSERPGSPVTLAADVPSTAMDANNGHLTLNALTALQRAALAETNGAIVIAEGSHGDVNTPYHGWLLAYDATTLAPLGVHNVTPGGTAGGVWQAGQGFPIDDAGDLYYLSGNGTFDQNANPPDLGDSMVRMHVAGGLAVVDWFTPVDQAQLDAADLDLGSAGALLLSGPGLLVGGGKQGKLYVVDKDRMGHFGAVDAVVQEFQATARAPMISMFTGLLHGTPVFWNGALYVGGEDDHIYGYRFNGQTFETAPFATSDGALFDSLLAISANGAHDAVLWANTPTTSTADGAHQTNGTLHAYDAQLHELWNSDANPRDALGVYAKFSVPSVVDGKVFTATFSDALRVYGLIP